MKRKLLSLIVAAVLILGMIPMASAAESVDNTAGVLITGVNGAAVVLGTANYLNVPVKIDSSATITSVTMTGDSYSAILTKQAGGTQDGKYKPDEEFTETGTYTITVVAENGNGITETYTADFTIDSLSTGTPITGFTPSNEKWVTEYADFITDTDFTLNKNVLKFAYATVDTPDEVEVSVKHNGKAFSGTVTVKEDDGYATIDVSGAKIGDEYEFTLTTTKEDYVPETDTATEKFEITPAVYAEINEIDTYYLLRMNYDAGYKGISLPTGKNIFWFDAYGGAYFIPGTALTDGTLTLSAGLNTYCSVSNYNLSMKEGRDTDILSKNGEKTNASSGENLQLTNQVRGGSATFKLTLGGIEPYDFALGLSEETVYIADFTSDYKPIADTAPIEYYNIIATAYAGGTISPSGTVKVQVGGNKSFIIEPNSGYTIDYVIVDGVNKGAISAFTFTTVDASHYISAYFKKVSGTTTVPPTVIPPTTGKPSIPSTGVAPMVFPGAMLLLAGLAIIPKRRK